MPANTTFYFNAEQLPDHVYLEAGGRKAHCDCIVAAPCPEDPGNDVILVAYELKALGNLPRIVAELLSPRLSGHGAGEKARRLIEEHSLVEKFAGCLMAADRLTELFGLGPRAAVAALIVGFSDTDELVKTVAKNVTNLGPSSGPYVIKRAVYEAAEALLKTVTKMLEEKLAAQLQRRETRLHVVVGYNRSIWWRLCNRLPR